jgi:hypothetical protein
MNIAIEITASVLIAVGAARAARELVRLRRRDRHGWRLIGLPAARQLRRSLGSAAFGALVLLAYGWNDDIGYWTVSGIVVAWMIADVSFWMRRRALRRA